ncbi:MAG: PspC domain-containing protein [Bacteroidia bacterium]|jgi:phage shock protein PspC (stress-responsive transcriptional regulator)|nr:PspC domain-containing protein [Bacteroidales bacterium]MDD2323048.1 PspC domain-containing protein [Bacteroidales bacterium]MDD3962053.1 PspC domain-containing protein [Bacteroidales bacterium]MDY0286492.1 PspC domain-containing protein [Bacteroidales bacterium]NCD41885.1 PspC domain-containing protein [Bacteroidia bacterium]
MEKNRFYRSNTNRIIGGVCSGLGNYFDIDPVIMRVIFFILALAGGGGVLIYLLLWILVPESPSLYPNPDEKKNNNKSNTMNAEEVKFEEMGYDSHGETPNGNEKNTNKNPEKSNGALIAGLILIVLGFMFLVDRFIPAITFGDLWPIILIVIGGILIYENYKDKPVKK